MNFVQIAEFDWLPWQHKGEIFEKNLKIFSEIIRAMKLKLCIDVHDISLYIKYVPTNNGKSGNWHLFLCYCRYFDKSFTEMFLESSSTNHMNFVQIVDFYWLPWQPKCYIFEKKK